MEAAGLEEVDTYFLRLQNTIAWYIVTCPILELCLVADQWSVKRVAWQLWDQEGIDMNGMWSAAWELDIEEEMKDRGQ